MVATALGHDRDAPALTGGSDLDSLPALSCALAVGLGCGWAQEAVLTLRPTLGTRRQSARHAVHECRRDLSYAPCRERSVR